MTGKPWRIRLGKEAERDFVHILESTLENFGERQFDVYRQTLLEAIRALQAGPEPLGNRGRDDIRPGLRTLHVAREGRCGRRFIMYRAAPGKVIDVIRILYDGMDLARHVPPDAK